MDIATILIKLIFALIAGALIGYEREKTQRAAGLKTHMLSTLGSTVFAMVALQIFTDYLAKSQNLDLLRLIQGIAVGIGFIGAGAIIHSEKGVSGLSVAASVWIMSAIGIAIGLGYYLFAAITTVAVFITISIIENLENNKK